MFNVNVKDGTHAGWRTVKAATKPFYCPTCDKTIARYWVKCPGCSFVPPERG